MAIMTLGELRKALEGRPDSDEIILSFQDWDFPMREYVTCLCSVGEVDVIDEDPGHPAWIILTVGEQQEAY